MENDLLLTLQAPGANPGGEPTWATLTNPQLAKAQVDFYINQGYKRVAQDLRDYDLMDVSASITVPVSTTSIPLPQRPASPFVGPTVAQIRRVTYAPYGLLYTEEYVPGQKLVSFPEFMRACGNGLWLTRTSAIKPSVIAVSNERDALLLFPMTVQDGDVLTLYWAPIPTDGDLLCPTLVNPLDVPLIQDIEEAIVQWALSKLWMRERQAKAAADAKQAYAIEIGRLRANALRRSAGDTLTLRQRPAFVPGLRI
jgi:hypothetical protein